MKKNLLFVICIFGIFCFGLTMPNLNAQVQNSQQQTVIEETLLPSAPTPHWCFTGPIVDSRIWNYNSHPKKENADLFSGKVVLLWESTGQNYIMPSYFHEYGRVSWGGHIHRYRIVFRLGRK